MIIFFGDSITRDWPLPVPAGNAGIGGDTTRAMRERFGRDVLDHRPAVLHILGGINDIGRNEGVVPVATTLANLRAMVLEARAAAIRVVVGQVTPCSQFRKRPHFDPRADVRQLNAGIAALAAVPDVVVADYFTPLVDADDGLRATCSEDGLHPNAAGYVTMSAVARAALLCVGFAPGAFE